MAGKWMFLRRAGDMEDRSWYDNLRIDGFQEVDNEIWEQNERIFINGYF